MTEKPTLTASLRRWADARDRRYEQDHRHGAHGKTGTALLREAADEIERLTGRLDRTLSYREAMENLPEGTIPRG